MAKSLFWLSDEAWKALSPHLPRGKPGKPCVDDRRVISGILHVLKTGSRWRDVPPLFGQPTTIYNRYNRWSQRRVWQRIFERMAAAGPIPDELSIDSSHVKAHRSASGSKRMARPVGKRHEIDGLISLQKRRASNPRSQAPSRVSVLRSVGMADLAALDQKLAQVATATLRNAEQSGLSTRGRLAWYEAQLRCKVAGPRERAGVAHRGNQRGRVERADTGMVRTGGGRLLKLHGPQNQKNGPREHGSACASVYARFRAEARWEVPLTHAASSPASRRPPPDVGGRCAIREGRPGGYRAPLMASRRRQGSATAAPFLADPAA
jgi:transposase